MIHILVVDDAYSRLTDYVEVALDEADQFAAENEKVFVKSPGSNDLLDDVASIAHSN